MKPVPMRAQVWVALVILLLGWFVLRPLGAQGAFVFGKRAESRGSTSVAVGAYRVSDFLSSGQKEVSYRLSDLLLKDLKPFEAAKVLRKAVGKNPADARLRNLLGWSYYLMYNLSIPELREAVSLDPSLAVAHYNLGLAAGEKGLWEEVETQFKEVIRLQPDSPWGYNDLGWALYKQAKMAEAQSTLEQALTLDPDNPWVQSNLGWILYEQGRYKDAVAYFEKVAERSGGDIAAQYDLSLRGYGPYTQSDVVIFTAWYNLGLTYEKLGRNTDAINAFQHYLSLDQQGRWRKDVMGRIERLRGGT